MKLTTLLVGLFASVRGEESEEKRPKRYLLYDTNPGEGFNLRRDVYMRVANLVNDLRNHETNKWDWVLVLPPWGRIGYHWRERGMEQSRIKWDKFFDVEQLGLYIPVMELEEYFEEIGEQKIEEIWYLQRYAEGWGSGWQERHHERDCIDPQQYQTDKDRKFRGWFFGYDATHAEKFKCVSVQGFASILVEPLNGGNTTATSVMLDRAESLLHKYYGQYDFWAARRSMIFSSELRQIAANFRLNNLDSNDVDDKTDIWGLSWNEVERDSAKKEAFGGPYIGVHLRRKDFLYARKEELPSLEGAVAEIKAKMEQFNVNKVFIGTDGVDGEREQLKKMLGKGVVFFYNPTVDEEKVLKKGGVAIIDQIICANARYFVGSKESTFTFRIQEEREIMGFDPATTFDRLCPDGRNRRCIREGHLDEREDPKKHNCCDHHTHWKIVHTKGQKPKW